MLEYAREINVKKFMYISSGGVYKTKEGAIKETDDLLLPSELECIWEVKFAGKHYLVQIAVIYN